MQYVLDRHKNNTSTVYIFPYFEVKKRQKKKKEYLRLSVIRSFGPIMYSVSSPEARSLKNRVYGSRNFNSRVSGDKEIVAHFLC